MEIRLRDHQSPLESCKGRKVTFWQTNLPDFKHRLRIREKKPERVGDEAIFIARNTEKAPAGPSAMLEVI